MDTPVSPTDTGTPIVPTPLDILRPSGRKLTGILTTPSSSSSSSSSSSLSSSLSTESVSEVSSTPSTVSTGKPLVLLLHGLLSNKDHNFAPALANALTESLSVYTYRFDFRTGASPEEPHFRYRFCGFDEDLDDTECVTTYLTQQGYRIVGIIGHSRGGNIALMYASRHYASSSSSSSTHPGIIAISPRYQMKGMLEKFTPEQLSLLATQDYFDWPAKGTGFSGNIQVTKDDVDYVQNRLDMEKIVSSISIDTPLIFLHGGADKTIPSEDSHIAASVAHAETQLQIFSGANHTFQGSKLTAKLINACTEFLRNSMNGVRNKTQPTVSKAGKASNAGTNSTKGKGNTPKVGTPSTASSTPAGTTGNNTKTEGKTKEKSGKETMISVSAPSTLPLLYEQLLNLIPSMTEDYVVLKQEYYKNLVNIQWT